MKNLVALTLFAAMLSALSIAAVAPAAAQEQVAYNAIDPAVTFHNASVDLDQLESRLAETPAIGFWAKLRLKGELTEIVEGIGRHQDGSGDQRIDTIRGRFFTLADETAAKLKDADPGLSSTIASSRDAIWKALLRR